jgi:hypothetical protein
MAFPQVAATNSGASTVNQTDHAVNLPSGIVSGDLLIVLFGADSNEEVGWPGGWTELIDLNANTESTLSIGYRIADGTEGSTITVTTGTSEASVHQSYRITGHAGAGTPPQVSAGAGGLSSNANPDGLTPTGGAKDYLWIAFAAIDGSGNQPTVAPTNFTNLFAQESPGGSGHVCMGAARLELNAASQDPGTFTSPSDDWNACTLAVHPAAEVTVLPPLLRRPQTLYQEAA